MYNDESTVKHLDNFSNTSGSDVLPDETLFECKHTETVISNNEGKDSAANCEFLGNESESSERRTLGNNVENMNEGNKHDDPCIIE